MNIRKRRRALDITQLELAKQLGIKQQVVSNWESGRSDPRARDLPRIAEALHCTIDELYEEAPA